HWFSIVFPMYIKNKYQLKKEDPACKAVTETFMPTGFPSPAANYMVDTINLNEFLSIRSASCFLIKVKGDGMVKSGIHHGDLLIVDRSLSVTKECVVLAS